MCFAVITGGGSSYLSEKLTSTRSDLIKPCSQYDAGAYVVSVKPGSQYDAGAYVASVKPGSQ